MPTPDDPKIPSSEPLPAHDPRASDVPPADARASRASRAVRESRVRSGAEASGRIVEEVLAQAGAANAVQIELQFSDVTGALKSVSVPTRRLREVFAGGAWFDGSAMEGFAREVEFDLRLWPDPATFSLVEPVEGLAQGRLICEVVMPTGEPYRADPRAVLRSMVDAASEAGLQYLVAPEIEFFLFPARDGATALESVAAFGAAPPPDDASGYFERTRGRQRRAELEIVAALEGMGIQIDSSHHEVAPGQYEIDLPLMPALATADTIATLKPAVRELARARGMLATFMPKPFADVAGSGMHTHQVLVDADGHNVFFDPGDAYCLSGAGRAFVAGLLEHSPGMCAVLAPSVNSYKRLVPGYEAPVAGTWGRHSRGALVRVPTPIDDGGASDAPEGPRLELRAPDPSCNPYIAFAAMLAAGLDGLERGLELGPAVEELEHSYGSVRGHAVSRELPASLEAALQALDQDDVIVGALGSELVEVFRHVKSLEIAAYRRQVTPWELATYFERS